MSSQRIFNSRNVSQKRKFLHEVFLGVKDTYAVYGIIYTILSNTPSEDYLNNLFRTVNDIYTTVEQSKFVTYRNTRKKIQTCEMEESFGLDNILSAL